MSKLTKAEAGYIVTKTNVLCGDCVFLRDKNRCCYFGPKVAVSATTGSCNRFKQGPPDTVPFLEPFWTKAELGYLENSAGFGCRRCEEFHAPHDCERVSGSVEFWGCCDLWEKDQGRGGLSNEKLIQIQPTGGLKTLAMARKQA